MGTLFSQPRLASARCARCARCPCRARGHVFRDDLAAPELHAPAGLVGRGSECWRSGLRSCCAGAAAAERSCVCMEPASSWRARPGLMTRGHGDHTSFVHEQPGLVGARTMENEACVLPPILSALSSLHPLTCAPACPPSLPPTHPSAHPSPTSPSHKLAMVLLPHHYCRSWYCRRYRNSNYQSKDIAHVQKQIAQRMADKARAGRAGGRAGGPRWGSSAGCACGFVGAWGGGEGPLQSSVSTCSSRLLAPVLLMVRWRAGTVLMPPSSEPHTSERSAPASPDLPPLPHIPWARSRPSRADGRPAPAAAAFPPTRPVPPPTFCAGRHRQGPALPPLCAHVPGGAAPRRRRWCVELARLHAALLRTHGWLACQAGRRRHRPLL